LIALAGLEVVDAQSVVDELAVVAERQAPGQQTCIDAFLGEELLDLEMRVLSGTNRPQSPLWEMPSRRGGISLGERPE
jgi:hypothetical protein